MPKKTKTKSRGPEMKYDRTNLQQAVQQVKSGAMSLRKAAGTFNVPRSTLHDRVTEKSSMDAHPGRKPALPELIENKIVHSVKEASRQGIGISRKQLLVRTGDLCKKFRVTPFKKATPSKQWWEGLKKRHPELAIRKPEKLASARASMLNPVVVQKYMDDLGQVLQNLNLTTNPEQIWNCDETGRNFEHTPVRVIAEKGARNVVGRTSNNRTNITIMACVNAEGRHMSPMFIAKGKTSASVHGFNTSAAPEGTKWAWQENGWITDKIGEQWFSDVFLKECGEARPQLLILDGHSSHESLAILELARENNIHILCLPPHTTHILQPLDRSVFGPFSSAYNTATSQYLSENPLHSINKWSFPGIVSQAWERAFSPANIKNGFRACGIYPYNPEAISSASFEPSKPTDMLVSTSLHHTASATTSSQSTNDTMQAPVLSPLPSKPINKASASATISVPSTCSNTMTVPASCSHDDAVSAFPGTLCVNEQTLSDETHEILYNLIVENVPPTEEETLETFWNSEIENIFLPPKIVKNEIASKKKRNTSHRLLTSDDVLLEKRNVQEKKDEKERKKLEREQKKLNSKQGICK